MHALEKILCLASEKDEVKTGHRVEVNIDIAILHDREGPKVFQLLKDSKANRVWNADKLVMIFDHDIPSPTIEKAETKKQLLATLKKFRIIREAFLFGYWPDLFYTLFVRPIPSLLLW